jgi:hypothetical protein
MNIKRPPRAERDRVEAKRLQKRMEFERRER